MEEGLSAAAAFGVVGYAVSNHRTFLRVPSKGW